jgi:acyl-CoA synthetase (AMP-forming)/AMP-acid ligase II/acyl carrier protein
MSRGPAKISPELTTFVDLLHWRAQSQPNQIAYRFLPEGVAGEEVPMTYAQLDGQARAIASLLKELQCQGQRVVLLYPAGLDYVAAFFGCLYAGAIAVPAYPPRPNRSLQRIQSIIQDSEATVALTQEAVLSKLEQRFAECPELRSLYWLSTDDLNSQLADSWQRPDIGADSLALLQYTSGSTAAPKGVMISHDNLLHNSSLINEFFQDSPASSGVSWLPPYHDMGLVGGLLQPLYVGAPMALMPPVAFLQKPIRWLQAISHYRATTSGGPNFAYDLCVRKTTPEQWQALDLSSWRLAFSGAEPVLYETLQRFVEAFGPFGFRWESFYPCYGMAETTLMVTGIEKGQPPQVRQADAKALQLNQVQPPQAGQEVRWLVSCGQPSRSGQVQIVAPQTRQPCPEDTIGEIWVSHSRSTAQGYWKRPDTTQYSFAAHLDETGEGPFLRTGDLGFLHQGQLYVTGRLKDLIIIRGRNHYPQDIEATVEEAHPALRAGAGAAFSVDLGNAEQLVVVQELERSQLRKADPETVCSAIRRSVAEQHELQVSAIVLLKTNSLPKTSSGKIQRFLCRSGFLDRQLDAVYTWESETLSSLSFEEPENGPEEAERPQEESRADRPAMQERLEEDASAALRPVAKTASLSSAEEIQRWMVRWLAQALQTSEAAIDIRRPFAEYGLDSVTAVELADALETALGTTLEPTLAYEYPTIEALARHLARQETPAPASAATDSDPDLGDLEVDQLVKELEMLSDAEIQALLGQQNHS